MRKKALIFLDQDVTIRHFIISGVFKEIESFYDVSYVFHVDSTSSSKKNIYADLSSLPIKRTLMVDTPRSRGGRWEQLMVAGILRNTRKMENFQPMLRLLSLGHSPKLMWALSVAAWPGVFGLFRRLFAAFMGRSAPIMDLLEREKPDIMIHPSVLQGFLIDDLAVAAKRTGIPLVCLMNSWDNPSQKRAAACPPTKLVVWGQQAKEHAVAYFGIPAADVVVGGAAQFDIYRNPVGRSREDLGREFGVPNDRPVLMYAGCSKGVIESGHLKLIDDAIEAGEIPLCHVLYRPHPWRGRLSDGEADIRTLGLKHVTIDPYMEEYYDRITRETVPGFQLADYSVVVRLFNMVDATISPLSTMMVESAMCGKPVLFVDTAGDHFSEKITMRQMRELAHFSGFFEGPGVHECWETEQLAASVRRLLRDAQDGEVCNALRRHSEYIVCLGEKSYGQRLLELADSLTGNAAEVQGATSHAFA